MVQSFLDAGDKVKVIVSKIERTENHNDISPILLQNFLSESKANLEHETPDILIFRDQSPEMLKIVRRCAKKGVRVIHYTQKPSRRPPGLNELRRDLSRIRAKQLKRLPLSTITPLLHNKKNPPRLLHRTFYFPVNRNNKPRNKNHSPIKILQVGKLAQPLKRHDWTIRALAEISHPSHLTICGADLDLDNNDGTRSEKYYRQLVQAPHKMESNFHCQVIIKKDVPQHELWKEYANADIFVLPSLHEEFGISVLEAMAAGCATIVSDSAGSSRHIQNWKSGVVFPVDQYGDYRESMKKLIEDEAKRKKIQHNAEREIKCRHSKTQFRRFILLDA